MDAGNMLKPALARGELHCIGATTLDEYRKHIEKDAALERRFQPVFVEPADRRGHHLDPARPQGEIRACTTACASPTARSSPPRRCRNRYITDRFLPDKAIDLIDEAAARKRMEIDSKPEEIDELDRRIMQLEIEREALKKESDEASKERLGKLEEELAELEQQLGRADRAVAGREGQARRGAEAQGAARPGAHELEQAQRRGDFDRAGELAYGVIPELERKLAEAAGRAVAAHGPRGGHRRATSPQVVSRWTGIPVDRMLEGEREKLLQMEDKLHKRVVGQDEAVVAVCNAVRRARAGLQDPNRPIGSFLFLGPDRRRQDRAGKALAEFLFDDEQAMIRIDMSEYMEKHTVARLIGAPPGYVGYEEGGR